MSGGPQGARQGSMTVFLGGPATTDAEDKLLADISGRVSGCSRTVGRFCETPQQPLGTYNLAATARMLNLSEHLGIPASVFSK